MFRPTLQLERYAAPSSWNDYATGIAVGLAIFPWLVLALRLWLFYPGEARSPGCSGAGSSSNTCEHRPK